MGNANRLGFSVKPLLPPGLAACGAFSLVPAGRALARQKAEAELLVAPNGISSLRSDIPSRLRRAVLIKREKDLPSKLEVLFPFY